MEGSETFSKKMVSCLIITYYWVWVEPMYDQNECKWFKNSVVWMSVRKENEGKMVYLGGYVN